MQEPISSEPSENTSPEETTKPTTTEDQKEVNFNIPSYIIIFNTLTFYKIFFIKLPDKDVFCVPLLPAPMAPPAVKKSPSKPVQEPRSSQPPALNYTAPDWSSKPPPVLGENQLNEEGFCDHYFFEVVKTGTVLDPVPLNKPYMSFGRLDLCDVLCEHPSLSRFHTILQYSNGDVDSKFPKGYYAYDLNSTHGTFINKKRIEANKFVPLSVDSIIKFGLSTRMYILHGPKPANSSDDLNINLSHDQMKKIKQRQIELSMKLKARKELEEEEMDELEKLHAKNSEGISWGMRDNDEDNAAMDESEGPNPDAPNPFAVIGESMDESYYSGDPKKALRVYFEREGSVLIYWR